MEPRSLPYLCCLPLLAQLPGNITQRNLRGIRFCIKRFPRLIRWQRILPLSLRRESRVVLWSENTRLGQVILSIDVLCTFSRSFARALLPCCLAEVLSESLY